MPEMPEVETIRRTLTKKVEGRMIQNLDVRLPRLIKWPSPESFQAIIRGKQILSLERRGKYLIFHLEDAWLLVVHLRMTGRLQYVSSEKELDKYARIIFFLDNQDVLVYSDTRTLGTLYLIPADEVWRISGLVKMGPEPLTPEFTIEYFREGLKKRQAKIKALLLDQSFIGGLGNIYVDESLYLAAIHPERVANSLSDDESKNLFFAVNQVIGDSIVHGGTTFRDYRDGLGNRGSHQRHLKVYGRKGEYCERCESTILWKEVGGRGTHYCEICQK